MRVLVLGMVALVLIGCGGASQPPQTVEVTRVVEVTREVPKPIEVTRAVAVTVEITRPIEVTRQVDVTRVVEVTRLVEVTPQIVATSTQKPSSVPTKVTVKSWTPEQVIIAFKAAGLEAENSKKMTKEDYGLAPLVGQGLRFLIPSLCADCGGRVFAVESEDDMTQLKAYYDELGKASAAFFSWTFRHGNVLVQLNGDLPEQRARVYETTLQAMQ
jgi:hypothetical protein